MAQIKIETLVDSSAFVSFFDTFSKYREAYEAQPESWDKAALSAAKSSQSFEEAAKSVRGLADNMSDVLRHARGFERSSTTTAMSWTKMARDTYHVAGNITSATVSLLKWAGVTSLVTGILGGGGLYGLDSLAHSVGGNRSSALGLNTSYGGLQSTRVNYARFGNPEGLLERIATAQSDIGSGEQQGLNALGVEYKGRDSADVGADALEALKRRVDEIPVDVLGTRLDATNIGKMFPLNEAMRVKNAKPEEVHAQAEAMRRDRGSMDLSPSVQRKWQDLSTQLSRAATQIETTFVTRLVALDPGLTKLSGAAADLATHLLEKGGVVSTLLAELNDGLVWLADNIDRPAFQDKVTGFVSGVVSAGETIWSIGVGLAKFLHFLGVLAGDGSNPTAASPRGGGQGVKEEAGVKPETSSPLSQPQAVTTLGGNGPSVSWGDLQRYRPQRPASSEGPSSVGEPTAPSGEGHKDNKFRPTRGGWWTPDRIQHAYDRLVANGVSPKGAEGLISRWAYVESGKDGPDSVNSTGHRGIAQWDAERWSKVGGDKGFDAQLDAVPQEMRRGERRAGVAVMSAKSDYDAARGASLLERGEHFNKWTGEDDFTGRTQAGIPRIHDIVTNRKPAQESPQPSKMAPKPVTSITINKNTGGNPIQTSAAAAAPP